MADINRNDWEKALDAAAVRAADSDYETAKAMGAFPNNPELLEKRREEAFVKYRNELESKMPFEGATGADLDELDAFKSENLRLWLGGRGPGPKETAKAVEASKFLPILSGVAEQGKDWMTMGSPALKEYALSLGYKPGTPEGFNEFLKKVGEYQQEYDRAQVAKEMREKTRLGIPGTNIEFGPDGSAYLLGTLASPSSTKAIENAVVSGSKLSAEKAAALSALDAGANSLIFTAPSLSVLKGLPVVNNFVNAGTQAGVELARQYAANAIDESIEPNADDAAFAAMAGATRPVLIRSAQGLVQQVPGSAATSFARGVGKATRKGDPTALEREGVKTAVDEYNKLLKSGQLATGEKVVNEATAQKLLKTNATKKMVQDLGVKPNADGTYSTKAVLESYDKTPVRAVSVTPEGVKLAEGANVPVKAGQVLVTPEYAQYAGAKLADEGQRNFWSSAGLKAGKILGDVGGRVEPTFKIKTYDTEKIAPEYKNTTWYKKIQKKSPESAKILDAAFKKKDEEE